MLLQIVLNLHRAAWIIGRASWAYAHAHDRVRMRRGIIIMQPLIQTKLNSISAEPQEGNLHA